MMGFLGIVAIVAYAMKAAYDGKFKSALVLTGQDFVKASWFIIGVGILYEMHENIKPLRDPINIFTAIVVVAFFVHSRQELTKEITAVRNYFATIKMPATSNKSVGTSSGSNVLSFPGGSGILTKGSLLSGSALGSLP